MTLLAGLDAGGTAFKCIVANTGGQGEQAEVLAEHKVPVTTPEQTIAACTVFFNHAQAQFGPLAAMGIGSFGPVNLTQGHPQFGHITSTPKPGWANTPILECFNKTLSPTPKFGFDTDVNAALMGEVCWGAAQGCNHAVYITIGTGIGVGAMVDGLVLHGAMHPEVGHMRVPKLANDTFTGICPFHGDCLEGLVAGPALAKRLGAPAETAPSSHAVWTVFTHYIGVLCANLALTYSPERIILGGGVSSRQELIPRINHGMNQQLNGYLSQPPQIVAAGLGTRAGAFGAVALAMNALEVN